MGNRVEIVSGRALAATKRWARYLAKFHAARPGVTEQVLERAFAAHYTPYSWLARAVSSSAEQVLDLCCGSGHMNRELAQPGRTIIGLDLSEAELTKAAEQAEGPWVLADARDLPIADESMDVVVSTLGLAVVRPVQEFISEAARVLKPGGVLVLTTPSLLPLNAIDLKTAARISMILRSAPRFPGHVEVSADALLRVNGLRKVESARERFRFAIHNRDDAELLLSAMYLPHTSEKRIKAAADYLVKQAQGRGVIEVPIPMRRIVAVK